MFTPYELLILILSAIILGFGIAILLMFAFPGNE